MDLDLVSLIQWARSRREELEIHRDHPRRSPRTRGQHLVAAGEFLARQPDKVDRHPFSGLDRVPFGAVHVQAAYARTGAMGVDRDLRTDLERTPLRGPGDDGAGAGEAEHTIDRLPERASLNLARAHRPSLREQRGL